MKKAYYKLFFGLILIEVEVISHQLVQDSYYSRKVEYLIKFKSGYKKTVKENKLFLLD